MINLYANEILLIVAFLFVKILNDWNTAFLVISHWFYRFHSQGRREPNVGPGPAQILRISGFVNSKTDGENAQFCPNYDVISKERPLPKF